MYDVTKMRYISVQVGWFTQCKRGFPLVDSDNWLSWRSAFFRTDSWSDDSAFFWYHYICPMHEACWAWKNNEKIFSTLCTMQASTLLCYMKKCLFVKGAHFWIFYKLENDTSIICSCKYIYSVLAEIFYLPLYWWWHKMLMQAKASTDQVGSGLMEHHEINYLKMVTCVVVAGGGNAPCSSYSGLVWGKKIWNK